MDLVRYIGVLHQDPGASGHAIPLSQVFALHELDAGTPLSQQELAARLGLEKSTVSRLVAGMERHGLLVRERDPDNRRFYRLRITEAGHAEHGRLGAGFSDRYAQLTATLTRGEREALLTGLPGLLRALRPDGP